MSDSLQAALNEIVYIVRFPSSTKGRKYFVYGPTAQQTYDKKELWEMIKNDSEIYARIVADTGLAESEIEYLNFSQMSLVLMRLWKYLEMLINAVCTSHIPTPHPTPPCCTSQQQY